ncbi:MAG: response regulator [Legionella sp.]|nr:response regulator [Legionella sp.]
MHVLIIEDSAFNAFCLTRLMQAACPQIQVITINNSVGVLSFLEKNRPSLIILDGDLRPNDELNCNGPALADAIWSNHSNQLPIIAWTDSESMRLAFAEVFKQHKKPFNDYHYWTKVVSQKRILQTIAYLIGNDSLQYLPKNDEAEALYA